MLRRSNRTLIVDAANSSSSLENLSTPSWSSSSKLQYCYCTSGSSVSTGKVKWTFRVLLCILFAYYLASIVAKSATCVPLRKLWIPGLDGHCFNNTILLLTDCGVSIVSDFAILVIPIPLIWDLHIPIRRKMELTTVFGLGVLYVRTPFDLMGQVAKLEQSARASRVLCGLTIPALGSTSMTPHTITFESGFGCE